MPFSDMRAPQQGGGDLSVGARVYACLGGSARRDEVRRALAAAGYDIAAVDSPDELLNGHVSKHAVVLLDVDVVGSSLLRFVTDLVGRHAGVRVVLLGSIGGPEEFLSALAAGVAGFCPPDASVGAIVRTLDDVGATGVAVPRSLVAPLVDHLLHGRGHRVRSAAGPIDVTEREWQILMLLLQRRSTREMSDALFVSVGTVRSHVSALLRKLGAVDREDAIRMIERHSG